MRCVRLCSDRSGKFDLPESSGCHVGFDTEQEAGRAADIVAGLHAAIEPLNGCRVVLITESD